MQNRNLIEPYRSKNITCPHGFFTRKGGVSKGLFDSLNCGHYKGDTKEAVEENRRRVAETFGKSAHHLCLIVQTHSNHVHIIDDLNTYKQNPPPEGDALITRLDNVILGILTADCGPILIHDPVQRIVAAIHAGWRGAVSGILENTVNQFIQFGSKLSDLEAAIGPCLWKNHFAVRDDFIQQARSYLKDELDQYLSTSKNQGEITTTFDLPLLILNKLKACGVENVIPSPCDTYSHNNAFFSYRRKTHKNEEYFGGQISCIMQS